QWTKEEGLRQAAATASNQFVPLNTNPKEVQAMRNKIREQNLQDIKTAGPQSQVLTGSVMDRNFVQGELVTASKAIIEKEYQPRVIVSSTGPNPFNKFTDQELEEYHKEVERKQKDFEDPSQPVPEEAEEVKEQSPAVPTPTRTPPSTPTKAEEESQQEHTYKDESDAATLRQTLPDLTPDEPSEALTFPTSGREEIDSHLEDLTKSQTGQQQPPPVEDHDSQPTPVEQATTQAPEDAAAAADPGSDESPSKSPSKKKKKFRTPSFLKKNKKKTDS
ncbi:UNVERIFIED_CONTAM: hypothetical protein FKN15_066538, partial [Acipenser sinensis]